MAQKFSSVDKDERKAIEDELESKSQALGMDSYETYGNDAQTGLKELIGMCYNCKNLHYCKSEYGNVHAVCSMFEFKLSGQNRIVECNLHAPKHVLSLNEMYNIAYLIDPDTDKKVKGFVDTNKVKGNKGRMLIV
jgi:hypothetical protein